MTSASSFVQTATEHVYMGQPASEAVLREAEARGARRVFLVAGQTLDRDTEEVERIKHALGDRCAGSYSGVPPHAPRGAVLEATRAARDAGADLLVSVGGGSVTDATKIAALGLKHDFDRHEDFEAYRMRVGSDGAVEIPEFEGPDVRVVCVPTTLSGGEFNPLSGATDEINQLKQGYTHRLMAPVAVVLDPSVTLHTPQWLWLSTGVRAVDHAAETLGSHLSNEFCDGMAENALKLLSAGLRQVKRDPHDTDARLKCQIGAWQSMVPIVSGVPMGLSHATGHALGGTFDVPHGYTSCAVAPFALSWNASVNADRQERISAAMGQPGRPAPELVAALIGDLEMPSSLTDLGLAAEHLDALGDAVMEDIWARTNPRAIDSSDDVVRFLRTAL